MKIALCSRRGERCWSLCLTRESVPAMLRYNQLFTHFVDISHMFTRSSALYQATRVVLFVMKFHAMLWKSFFIDRTLFSVNINEKWPCSDLTLSFRKRQLWPCIVIASHGHNLALSELLKWSAVLLSTVGCVPCVPSYSCTKTHISYFSLSVMTKHSFFPFLASLLLGSPLYYIMKR